ncbi:MAG: hemerythrin domain-containing protein [Thiotrichales bacterium]|jgi:hemerythrin-like domain-containing protein|nr:hemerythrin domain-containing protein [Thiotrichales bacterium]
MNISEFMSEHHRECDNIYVKAEGLVSEQKWQEANDAFTQAYDNFMLHFDREEQTLFPEFEQKTGMDQGPTQMMRSEHMRMKATLEELKESLQNKDKDKFLGNSEAFMIFVQQHNMKEEQMLYAMMDRIFDTEAQELIAKIS